MFVKGVGEKSKPISINNDFSILISKPLFFIDTFNDNTLLKIFRPTINLVNYKNGNFSIDDNTPINGNFSIYCSGTFDYAVSEEDYEPSKVLEDYDINNMLKKLSSEAKNVTLNLSINANSSTTSYDSFKRKYKVCINTPTLKVGYYTMGIYGKTTYVPLILTTHAAYSGQILFSNEDYDDNEEWLETLLSSIKPLNEEKKSINLIDLKDLETLTFSNTKSTIKIGSLILVKANELLYVNKKDLPDNYDLIATSKSYNNNKLKYKDAPIGICINKPIISDTLTKIWNLSKKNIEKNIIDNFKNSLKKSLGKYDKDVKILKLEKNYSIIYGQTNSAKSNEPYWTSYAFAIFHNDMVYYGMIYFNCNKPSENEIEKNVISFLENIVIDEKKADNKSKEERIRILGQFAAKNGKIDAIKVNNMFFEDIVFNNPEEIVYKNGRHTITGLQMNIQKVDDFPNIKNNYQLFVLEIKNIMDELENNKKLIINSNEYHKNFNKVTKKEPITGIIYLLFAAWHMIKIVEESKNKYKVLIDQNIINGIPNGYFRLMEYIRTLRLYNDLDENFECEFIGAMNIDGPTGVISNPVDNSDRFQSSKKISYKDISSNKEFSYSKQTDNLSIEGKVDIKILKYLNHEIPLIYNDIQTQCNKIESKKQLLLKNKNIETLLESLMKINDDSNEFNWKVNLSFVGLGEGGSFSLVRYLDQLKVDTPFHPTCEYRINYEYSNDDDPKTFLDEIIKLYKNKNEIEIKKDIIKIINEYLNNNLNMKLSKEKMMFNSIIYDYDKEDLDFKESDFFEKKNSKKEKKVSEKESSNTKKIINKEIIEKDIITKEQFADKLKNEIDNLENTINEIKNDIKNQSDKIENDILNDNNKIKELEEQKRALGLFKISEKKALSENIKELQSNIFLNNRKKDELINNEQLKKHEFKLSILKSQKGNEIKFGYDPINGDIISWIVLDNNIDGVLLLSKYNIDMTSFYNSEKWLKDFEKNNFDNNIRELFVKNGNRSDVSTNIFLLSPEEIKKYLNTNLEAYATPQLTNREVNNFINSCMKGVPQETINKWTNNIKESDVKCYWLRGKVDKDGFANFIGRRADNLEFFVSKIGAGASYAIRPAVLIKNIDMENK